MRNKIALTVAVILIALTAVLVVRYRSLNVPIVFYGRVVGPDGVPIKNVSVSARVNALKFFSLPVLWSQNGGYVSDYLSAKTDEEGRFTLSGARGRSIEFLGFEHAGMQPAPGEFFYPFFKTGADIQIDDYHPDPTKPVQFTLEPKGERHVMPSKWR